MGVDMPQFRELQMIRRARQVIVVGLVGAVMTVSVGAVGPADAAGPGYTCDRTFVGNKDKGWGWLNCAAANGAPVSGPVRGNFTINSRKSTDPGLQCGDRPNEYHPSGDADTPDHVVGFFCTPTG
jgi:hypothetical protein